MNLTHYFNECHNITGPPKTMSYLDILWHEIEFKHPVPSISIRLEYINKILCLSKPYDHTIFICNYIHKVIHFYFYHSTITLKGLLAIMQ